MSSDTDQSTRWFKLLLYGVTVLYVLNLLVQTTTFDNVAAQRFPFLFGSLTFVFGVVLLGYLLAPETVAASLPTFQSGDGGDIETIPDARSEGPVWNMSYIISLTILFPIVIYVFGFAIGILLWVFGFTFYLRRDLKESAAISIGIFVIWRVLFVNLLGIIFYDGYLF